MNDSEKNHVAYGLASAYSIRAVLVDEYARYNLSFVDDQSSSHGLEKFGENIPTIPEVIGAHTLNFKSNFKFSSSKFLFFWWETPSHQFDCALASLVQSLARTKM